MLQPINDSGGKRYAITDFRGINQTSAASEKEFYDIKNMSNADYPALKVRKTLGKLADVTGISNIIVRENGIYFIKERRVVIEAPAVGTHASLCLIEHSWSNSQELISETNIGQGDVQIKQLVNFGAYILIFGKSTGWPYKIKKWINVRDNTFGDIDEIRDIDGPTVKFEMCRIDGSTVNYKSQSQSPSSPSDGDYWYNTTTSSLMCYSGAKAAWISVVTTYVKISYASSTYDITDGFTENDGVEFWGASSKNGTNNIPRYNMIHTLNKSEKYIVLTGLIPSASLTTSAHIQIRRVIPDMDICFAHEGRLWGCSSENHEIYASAQGSFANFIVYDGEAYDSWAATVATDGDFTGGVSFSGYPYFFKTDKIYKVHGSNPSEFSLQELGSNGCTDFQSIVQIDDTLYYHGTDGVYAMTVSSYPAKISQSIQNAVFGTVGCSYDGQYILIPGSEFSDDCVDSYVYDTRRGLWSKSDIGSAKGITNYNGVTYISGEDTIRCFSDRESEMESGIEWHAETALIGTWVPDEKYISQIRIRFSAEVGTKISVFIRYDGQKQWIKAYMHKGQTALKSYDLHLIPRKCDYFQIRIEGRGDFKLQAIAYTVK